MPRPPWRATVRHARRTCVRTLPPSARHPYAMAMPAHTLEWTADMARALPDDGQRYEVLSPGTARADRQVKRRLYQDEGVAEYWTVDADARLVERWRPTDTRPALCDGSLTWTPREDVPPLTLDLGSVFGPDEPDGLPERPR